MDSRLRFYLYASSIVNAFLVLFLLASMCWAEPVEVLTIAYEASSQPLEGQIAVANVIKTRMAERRQTAEEVVLAPYQFSCWHPKTHKPTQKRKLSLKAIETAKKAWRLSHVWEYNHYCRYDVKPYWIKAAKKSLRIGDHVFYQL